MNTERLLVIAPHPDDEINLAGQLIYSFTKNNKEVYVLYTTNGDATFKIGNSRMYEAIDACMVLGVPRKNVYFLGYANEWKNNKHIYYTDTVVESAIGKLKTNGLDEIYDYSYRKRGLHSSFTFPNFKNDLKSAIEEIRADIIVAVDYDAHPDHRAASLTFDRVIGELLSVQSDYRPLVLKKYAYNGVWWGNKDYYSSPMKPTKCKFGFPYGGMEHQLESPNFLWADRVVVKTPQETRTPLLKKNILYKAAYKHKNTTAWYLMQRVINSDVVYWWRPTGSLLYGADFSVSSGDHNYLHDFMMYDSADVLNIAEPIGGVEYAWRPNDKEKSATIRFAKKEQVQQINIYEDFCKENHIKALSIYVGSKHYVVEPNRDGSCTKVLINDNTFVDTIKVVMEEWIGNPGITEIEAFRSEQVWDETYLNISGESTSKDTYGLFTKIAQKIEKILLMVEFALRFKIKYEFERLKVNR